MSFIRTLSVTDGNGSEMAVTLNVDKDEVTLFFVLDDESFVIEMSDASQARTLSELRGLFHSAEAAQAAVSRYPTQSPQERLSGIEPQAYGNDNSAPTIADA